MQTTRKEGSGVLYGENVIVTEATQCLELDRIFPLITVFQAAHLRRIEIPLKNPTERYNMHDFLFYADWALFENLVEIRVVNPFLAYYSSDLPDILSSWSRSAGAGHLCSRLELHIRTLEHHSWVRESWLEGLVRERDDFFLPWRRQRVWTMPSRIKLVIEGTMIPDHLPLLENWEPVGCMFQYEGYVMATYSPGALERFTVHRKVHHVPRQSIGTL